MVERYRRVRVREGRVANVRVTGALPNGSRLMVGRVVDKNGEEVPRGGADYELVMFTPGDVVGELVMDLRYCELVPARCERHGTAFVTECAACRRERLRERGLLP